MVIVYNCPHRSHRRIVPPLFNKINLMKNIKNIGSWSIWRHTITIFSSIQTNTITTASEFITAACSFRAVDFILAICFQTIIKFNDKLTCKLNAKYLLPGQSGKPSQTYDFEMHRIELHMNWFLKQRSVSGGSSIIGISVTFVIEQPSSSELSPRKVNYYKL